MLLLLFSGCIKSLNLKLATTSSEKFEIEFALNMAEQESSKVIIFSEAIKYGEIQHYDPIYLIGVRGRNRLCSIVNFVKAVKKKLEQVEDSTISVLIYGYDLLNISCLLYIKYMYNINTLSFIFDTHTAEINKLKNLKKILGNIYFNLAIKLLNLIDGIILFQEEASRELHLKKPYCVSRPGINKNKISNYVYNKQKSKYFTIIYMGSLLEYNGISQMLEAFHQMKDTDIRLRIFGSGKLVSDVIGYSKKDNRIYYGGLINGDMILEELRNADLLLNLRMPDHYVCKFAYPSKLVEYMATGVPVLSSNLNFDSELKDSLYVLNEFNIESILELINYIKNDELANKVMKVSNAKEYLMSNNNWADICKDIKKFTEVLNI